MMTQRGERVMALALLVGTFLVARCSGSQPLLGTVNRSLQAAVGSLLDVVTKPTPIPTRR